MYSRKAFSLVEMLVVIAIITLLISFLLPSLRSAKFEGVKSKCAQQMRQLAVSADAFSVDHSGKYIHARSDIVQIAIDPKEQDQFASYGYAKEFWRCPGRDYEPQLEASFGNQLVVGYQYFGGITTWRNHAGDFPSKSPVLRAKAGPTWIVAADTSIKVDGVWGGGRKEAFGDMPSHRRTSIAPEGSNQTFVDGSTRWMPFKDMYMMHSWSINARMCFFRQDDLPGNMQLSDLVPATDHLD